MGWHLLESSLPNMLRLLFIFYPIVSNVAFEAFSCYTFDFGTNDTRAFLIIDVDIECSAPWGGSIRNVPEHDTIIIVAFVAVALYPVGLFVFNGMLLFASREAIRSGKSTPLSRATLFLHQEYEPAFFYWEVSP